MVTPRGTARSVPARSAPARSALAGAPSVGAAFIGGAVTSLGFPEPGWWPCAVLGTGLWLATLPGRGPAAGGLRGLAYGLGPFLPLLHWSGVYVGAVPWLALAVLQSLYLAALGAVLPRALLPWSAVSAGHTASRSPGPGLIGVLATAGLFTGQEALRSRTPFGGFPWGRLAFSQADSPLGHLAAWGGAPLVTFATVAAAALLAWTSVILRPGAGRRRRAPLAAATGALVWVVLAIGLAVPLPTTGRTVRVAGVQGNVPRAGLDFNAQRRAVLDNHARVAASLAGRVSGGLTRRPDLMVWPENSSDLDPYREPDARRVIDQAVDAVGAPTLVGTVLQRPDGRLANASLVWLPGQGPTTRYEKRHPVPFAEYVPYRPFFRSLSPKVDLVRVDFAAGDEVGTLRLGPARVGVSICFEVAYDDLVRDTVLDGADLLVVQTNNATFGRTDESVQQLAMSRLRAIEHGRAVLHVSTVGVSALITPDGREVARSRLFAPATLEADLPLRHRLTLADRLGRAAEAALVLIGLLGTTGLMLAGRRSGRRGTGLRAPADQNAVRAGDRVVG
jgi:apolipoprotein N-acyltransferase